MDILQEINRFIKEDEENEDMPHIIKFAKKFMAKNHKTEFDEEVEEALYNAFGTEYIGDHLDEIKSKI